MTESVDWPPANRWIPLKGTGMEDQLLVSMPADAFARSVPDDARGGFPSIIMEAFWITAPVFHLLRVDGFTLDAGAVDDVDERTILSHERISLEQVLKYEYEFGPEAELGGTIKLVDGRSIEVPGVLLDSHLNGGPEGYGRTAPDE